MTKKTKILLTTIGISLVPLVSASCGQLKFDQVNDKKIKIATNFERTGAQAIALEEILRVYNETQKNEKDFLPVSLDYTSNTYSDSAKKLENQLRSKDAANLQNLIIGYPSVLASVAEYGMELFLADNGYNSDNYSVKKQDWEEDFIAINDRIGGLKKGGIYGLPMYKSTLVTALNAPVLSYIFETMVSYGAIIKPEDKSWYDSIVDAGKEDREHIKTIYGTPVESEKTTYQEGKVVISKDIFNTSLEMLRFAKNAQRLFTNTRDNPVGGLHIMGIDDISSFLSINVFSMTAKEKNDFKNHFMKLKNDGYVDYSGYADKESPEYKSLSEIAKELIDVAKEGALYVANPPTYTSLVIRRHQLAFAIGSSAGYSYNFFEDSSRADTVFIKKNLKETDVNIDISISSVVAEVVKDGRNDNANFLTEIKQGSTKSNVYKFGKNPKDVKFRDIVLEDEDTSKKVEEFIKTAVSQDNTKKPLLIANSKDIDGFFDDAKGKNILNAAGIVRLGTTSRKKGIYGVKDANLINTGKFENKSYLEFRVFSNAETLQQKELFGINAPRKWKQENKINGVYVQGPLMIGIHANEVENKATRKFIKWLSSSTSVEAFKYRTMDRKMQYKNNEGKFTDNIKEAKKETPFSYIFQETSYLVPYKGVFNDLPVASNPFLQNAINEFKKSVENKDNTWSLVDEPIDSLSNSFKNSFISAWRTPFLQISEGNRSSVKGSYEEDIKKRIDTLLKGTVLE